LPGGKVENVLQCIAQDSSGVLWFGTQNGLVKYDGRQYKRYLHNSLDSNSLISSYVECIHVDPDGILWVGAFEYGFTRFDPVKHQFRRYYVKGAREGSESTMGVNVILRYSDHIWLGTHNGILRYSPERDEFKRYHSKPFYKDIFNSNTVRALHIDRSHTLWAGMGFTWSQDATNGGLYKYLPEKDHFIEYRNDPTDKNSLSDNRIKGIFEDSKNNFWIGTMGDGLHKMDRTNNRFISFPYQPENPDQLSRPRVVNADFQDNIYNQVQFIHEDQHKRLWIGSFDNGLNIYDPSVDKQIHFERGMNGLETNNIWNIFQSKDNVIFICTGGNGQGKNYKVEMQRSLFPFFEVNSNLSLNEIIQKKDENILFGLGTDDELMQFDPKKKTFNLIQKGKKEQLFFDVINDRNTIPSTVPIGLFREFEIQKYWKELNLSNYPEDKRLNTEYIYCAQKDSRGNIWIGTWGGGLFRLNTKSRTIKNYKYDTNSSSSLGGDHISVSYEDKDQNIWIGGGKETKNLNHPFFLDRLDVNADTFIHYYGEMLDYGYPSAIDEDQNGYLWYATCLDGLHRLDISTGTVSKYNKSNSLIPSDEIRALVIDEADNIWMSTEKKLVRFTPNRQSFIEYSEKQGIKTEKFEFGSACITQDQMIYFGGLGGFHAFNPKSILQKDYLPSPVILISEFLVKKKEELTPSPENIGIVQKNRTLSLKHNENTFFIGFSLIDYHDPKQVYLEYKLENHDHGWQKADEKKTASYYNLQPGKYSFKVRGANSRGLWNKEGQQIIIHILPPWWKTWWAKLLYMIIGFVVVYLFIRWRTYALEKRQKILEQMVREQTAELTLEKERSESLLLNILPSHVAEELKKHGSSPARHFEQVTVLFTDFKQFTTITEQLSAEELVAEINICFKAFDEIIGQYNIEKIKTVGDAYMAAAGLQSPKKSPPKNVILAAIKMQEFIKQRKKERQQIQLPFFEMRCGIHTGPVVAGIVGIKKFQYDIWGDTVNVAARIESSCMEGKVNISQATFDLIKNDPQFKFTSRGKVKVKHEKEIRMYYVALK